MTMALDNLGNQVTYASDFDKGGEDIAYALYDLARAGRAAIGDLRYYLEARLDNFGSPLAKAQLGAALALYGDRTRAAEAFAAAVEGLKEQGRPLRASAPTTAASCATPPRSWRSPPSSRPSGVDLAALTERLADLRDAATLDLDAGRCLDADRRRRARPRDRRRLDHDRRRRAHRLGLSPLRPGVLRRRRHRDHHQQRQHADRGEGLGDRHPGGAAAGDAARASPSRATTTCPTAPTSRT